MWRPACLWLILTGSISINAQDTLRTHTSLFGIGHTNQLDTYLSPYEYTGTEVRFMQDNIKPTRWMHKKISMQNLIQAYYSYAQSAVHEGNYLAGMVEWSIAGHYHWQLHPRWDIAIGPQLNTYLGGIYNTHNGNNPAQIRTGIKLNASAKVCYEFPFLHRTWKCTYQGDFLIAGACFSPEYGESYYEIFTLEKGGTHNIRFIHPFQAICYQQMIRLSVPLKTGFFNIGIVNDIQQNRIYSLKNHTWSNLFFIGYTKQFLLIPCK